MRRGDTISRIATRYGLEEVDLIRLNRLRNGNRIFIGQTIQLSTPVGESEKSVAPPAQITVAVPEPAPADPPDVVEEAPADEKIGVAASERDEASDQNTNPPGESAPSLVADPSDYSVSSDGSIEVQAVETLGHYAEWLGVRASRLRALNRMRYGDPVVVGHRLRLDFSRVPTDQFERQRLEFHRETQGEFFERFEIAGTQVHVMRRGDSLWTLSKRKYRVPLWLLRQYNPDLDFEDLQPGTQITIPLLKPHKGDGDAAATQSLESAGLQVQVPVEAHRLGGEGLLDLK